IHADPMWDGWQRSGAPVAAWLSPAASAVALAHGLLGNTSGFELWRARAEITQGSANPTLTRNNASFAAFVDIRLAIHTGAAGDSAVLVTGASASSVHGWHEAYVRAAAAELAVLAGLRDAEARLAAAAASAQENDWAAACVARVTGRLYSDSQ